MVKSKREINKEKRHRRIRKKIFGTGNFPRVVVHRSNSNLYVQIVDDLNGRILLAVSTNNKKFKEKFPYGGNVKAARLLGEILAERANAQGVTKVVFDRGGYLFHGRIRALAESAREHGLKF